MALRATMAASTTVATTIGLLCVVVAVTWTAAYSRGRRHGRSELAEDDAPCTSSDNKEVESASKQRKKKDEQNNNNINNLQSNNNNSLTICPIGKVTSIYRLCVGTPRQGMLAKHSRGIITFDETQIWIDSILELENYSYVYVVFIFHLNSNMKTNNNDDEEDGEKKNGSSSNSGGSRNNKRQFKGKISPPSLGGKKVGVFSTRTPHRPNPVGFSLCKLDKVIVHNTKKKGKKTKSGSSGGNGKGKNTFSLLLSGLDLVDGTPIL